jgi:hypothetical protein
MLELILPIVGLGIAVATVKNVAWRWVLLSLAAGLAVGFLTPLAMPDEFALAAMFIAIGALLICSNSWVQRLIAPISFFIGGYIGHIESLATSHDLLVIGFQAAVLLLVGVAVALARKYYRIWFAIPRRIGGSWMLAAGGMLLAVLIRAPDSPIMISGTQPSPLHDPNQPHIHGANGEIIYLPSGKGEQPSTPPKTSGSLEGITGKQIDP